ncbi:hypothetical protein MVEN_01578100 [Mycena venus]|uniref:Uncharacterized protein n=1 Tax=Mycena venus TaxID=2733690 RepID=A0A8H6XQG3_9AGAR|nr:hypothetical protein MVEN_01578100 [Mycena venus]
MASDPPSFAWTIPSTAVTIMEQTGELLPVRRNPPSYDSPDHAHRPQRSKILLMGGGTALAVFLVLAGLLIFVLAKRDFHIDSGVLVTSASLGKTLAITNAASTIISGTVPLLLVLEGYRIASVWLMASGDGGINRPTPYQLGVLMTVLSKGNLSGLWTGIACACAIGGEKRKAPPLSQPPILRLAVITLALLLGLAYACQGFDTWLHVSSRAVLFPQLKPWPGPQFMASRAINQTACAEPDIFPFDPLSPHLCGLVVEAGANSEMAGGLPEGIRVLNNASELNAVVFTNDNIVIVVPPASQIPESIQWIGNTVGVRSTCRSITADCVDIADPGPEAFLEFNCPPSSSINNTALNLGSTIGFSYPFGIIDSQGNPLGVTPWHVETNHFHYLAVLISIAYVAPDSVNNDNTFVGDTGFFVHGHSGSWNIISCDVDVLDVQYAYVNGSYTTRYTTMADLNTTRRVVSLSDEIIPTQLPSVVDGVGLVSGNYAAAFSQELSKEMIALSSQIWINATADQVFNIVPNVGSRFPLAPLGLLVIFMALYGMMALFLTFLALRATSVQAYASIARLRLMDPLCMIHAAYGPMEASKTWKDDSKALFGVEGEQDRLNIGPMALPDGKVGFGVSRGFSW